MSRLPDSELTIRIVRFFDVICQITHVPTNSEKKSA
jgi:hypothetical protein